MRVIKTDDVTFGLLPLQDPLAIEIHEKLLQDADNFWLTGWLENQLKLLRGGKTKALSFK